MVSSILLYTCCLTTSDIKISNSQTDTDNDHSASGYLHLFNPSSTTFVKHFISNISVNSGDLLRIELVFSPSNGAKFIFGQNTIGTATYPETSAGLIATGPRAMFWLDIIEYLPQLP